MPGSDNDIEKPKKKPSESGAAPSPEKKSEQSEGGIRQMQKDAVKPEKKTDSGSTGKPTGVPKRNPGATLGKSKPKSEATSTPTPETKPKSEAKPTPTPETKPKSEATSTPTPETKPKSEATSTPTPETKQRYEDVSSSPRDMTTRSNGVRDISSPRVYTSQSGNSLPGMPIRLDSPRHTIETQEQKSDLRTSQRSESTSEPKSETPSRDTTTQSPKTGSVPAESIPKSQDRTVSSTQKPKEEHTPVAGEEPSPTSPEKTLNTKETSSTPAPSVADEPKKPQSTRGASEGSKVETKKPEPAYRDLAGNEYQADQIPKSDDVEGTKKFQKNVAWRELAGVTADAKPEKMREIIEKHGKSEDPEIQAHYRELFPEFDQGRYARVGDRYYGREQDGSVREYDVPGLQDAFQKGVREGKSLDQVQKETGFDSSKVSARELARIYHGEARADEAQRKDALGRLEAEADDIWHSQESIMEREAERKERFDQVQNDPMKWVKAAVPGYAHALPIHWDTQASRMDTSLSEDNGRRLGIVADQTRSLRRGVDPRDIDADPSTPEIDIRTGKEGEEYKNWLKRDMKLSQEIGADAQQRADSAEKTIPYLEGAQRVGGVSSALLGVRGGLAGAAAARTAYEGVVQSGQVWMENDLGRFEEGYQKKGVADVAGNVLENTPRIAADSVGAAVGYGLFNTARPVLSAGLAGAGGAGSASLVEKSGERAKVELGEFDRHLESQGVNPNVLSNDEYSKKKNAYLQERGLTAGQIAQDSLKETAWGGITGLATGGVVRGVGALGASESTQAISGIGTGASIGVGRGIHEGQAAPDLFTTAALSVLPGPTKGASQSRGVGSRGAGHPELPGGAPMRDVTPPHVREEIARSQSSRTSKPPRKSQGEVIDADFEMMPQQPETSAVSTKPHQQSQPADPLGLPAPRQIGEKVTARDPFSGNDLPAKIVSSQPNPETGNTQYQVETEGGSRFWRDEMDLGARSSTAQTQTGQQGTRRDGTTGQVRDADGFTEFDRAHERYMPEGQRPSDVARARMFPEESGVSQTTKIDTRPQPGDWSPTHGDLVTPIPRHMAGDAVHVPRTAGGTSPGEVLSSYRGPQGEWIHMTEMVDGATGEIKYKRVPDSQLETRGGNTEHPARQDLPRVPSDRYAGETTDDLRGVSYRPGQEVVFQDSAGRSHEGTIQNVYRDPRNGSIMHDVGYSSREARHDIRSGLSPDRLTRAHQFETGQPVDVRNPKTGEWRSGTVELAPETGRRMVTAQEPDGSLSRDYYDDGDIRPAYQNGDRVQLQKKGTGREPDSWSEGTIEMQSKPGRYLATDGQGRREYYDQSMIRTSRNQIESSGNNPGTDNTGGGNQNPPTPVQPQRPHSELSTGDRTRQVGSELGQDVEFGEWKPGSPISAQDVTGQRPSGSIRERIDQSQPEGAIEQGKSGETRSTSSQTSTLATTGSTELALPDRPTFSLGDSVLVGSGRTALPGSIRSSRRRVGSSEWEHDIVYVNNAGKLELVEGVPESGLSNLKNTGTETQTAERGIPNFLPGDDVMIPRTGGGYSQGRVTASRGSRTNERTGWIHEVTFDDPNYYADRPDKAAVHGIGAQGVRKLVYDGDLLPARGALLPESGEGNRVPIIEAETQVLPTRASGSEDGSTRHWRENYLGSEAFASPSEYMLPDTGRPQRQVVPKEDIDLGNFRDAQGRVSYQAAKDKLRSTTDATQRRALSDQIRSLDFYERQEVGKTLDGLRLEYEDLWSRNRSESAESDQTSEYSQKKRDLFDRYTSQIENDPNLSREAKDRAIGGITHFRNLRRTKPWEYSGLTSHIDQGSSDAFGHGPAEQSIFGDTYINRTNEFIGPSGEVGSVPGALPRAVIGEPVDQNTRLRMVTPHEQAHLEHSGYNSGRSGHDAHATRPVLQDSGSYADQVQTFVDKNAPLSPNTDEAIGFVRDTYESSIRDFTDRNIKDEVITSALVDGRSPAQIAQTYGNAREFTRSLEGEGPLGGYLRQHAPQDADGFMSDLNRYHEDQTQRLTGRMAEFANRYSDYARNDLGLTPGQTRARLAQTPYTEWHTLLPGGVDRSGRQWGARDFAYDGRSQLRSVESRQSSPTVSDAQIERTPSVAGTTIGSTVEPRHSVSQYSGEPLALPEVGTQERLPAFSITQRIPEGVLRNPNPTQPISFSEPQSQERILSKNERVENPQPSAQGPENPRPGVFRSVESEAAALPLVEGGMILRDSERGLRPNMRYQTSSGVDVVAATHPGHKTGDKPNQDRVFIADRELMRSYADDLHPDDERFVVGIGVADGVGGSHRGERAAQIVAEQVLQNPTQPEHATIRASNQIRGEFSGNSRRDRPETTLSYASLWKKEGAGYEVRHDYAGDSGMIIFRKNEQGRFTPQHVSELDSIPEQMRKDNGPSRLSERDARFHRARNIITRSIGDFSTGLTRNVYDVQGGDVVVNFSDGYGDNFTPQEMADMLTDSGGDLTKFTRKMDQEVKARSEKAEDFAGIAGVIHKNPDAKFPDGYVSPPKPDNVAIGGFVVPSTDIALAPLIPKPSNRPQAGLEIVPAQPIPQATSSSGSGAVVPSVRGERSFMGLLRRFGNRFRPSSADQQAVRSRNGE